jgi:hypothetical protein
MTANQFARGKFLSLTAGLFISSVACADQPAWHMSVVGPFDDLHNQGTEAAPIWSASIYDFNDAGQVTGTNFQFLPPGPNPGHTAWVFDGDETHLIGLTDSYHTSTNGATDNRPYFINASGDVTGTGNPLGGFGGRTTWLYRDGQTIAIGPTGGVFSRDAENPYGHNSLPVGISDAGEVAGRGFRYGENSDLGESAWVWDGSATRQIGYYEGQYVAADGTVQNVMKAMSPNGVAAGQARRFDGAGTGTNPSSETVWRWENGVTQKIGYLNNAHTTTTGYQKSRYSAIGSTGVIGGSSNSYAPDDTYVGHNAWLWDGGLVPVGLYADEHIGTGNFRISEVTHVNGAGQAAGYSFRYEWNNVRGESAWVYNGTDSVRVGLTDALHTRPADGWRSARPTHLNESGQAAGRSDPYDVAGNDLGASSWFFDGTTTVQIGLIGGQYTADVGVGYRASHVRRLLDNGVAIGDSRHYWPGSTDFDLHSWAYDGAATHLLGYTDAEHTDADGHHTTILTMVNDSGQAIGSSLRYDTETGDARGATGWFWNGTTLINIDAGFPSVDGTKTVNPVFLTDDGRVLGWFHEYDPAGGPAPRLYVPFIYTEAGGIQEITLDLAPELQGLPGNIYFTEAYSISAKGVIVGKATGAGNFAFALTTEPVVDVQIDVDPLSALNEVDPDSAGQVAVAVLTTSIGAGDSNDFDATQVDPATLELGRGNGLSVGVPVQSDVDGDTDIDVTFTFDIQAADIYCTDSDIKLTGQTFATEQFQATDSITPDCDGASCHP